AIRSAQRNAPFGSKIEVEVSDLAEVRDALEEKADILLLDNMTSDEVRAAVTEIRGRALVEVSGGITLGNVRDYALPGVDFISVGALTHSAPTSDVALEIEH
ncbi:MAG: hypothetical protein QOC87_1214, partial [Actinomycetota bacterium]|nr:hypothetical protein [Actinomycetota bacterium]